MSHSVCLSDLQVSCYSSNAENAFSNRNWMMFTTYYRDNKSLLTARSLSKRILIQWLCQRRRDRYTSSSLWCSSWVSLSAGK